ncbi:MAG: R3H domain-containing nucleic acid-binding protein [Mobiluncus porci]|uniref:Single-stranded DNA-binding protein n=1 Tax=Mobiluncus porci TaxID=2652278 RepID=A0A7K0K101_9ACTO|nr:MULTISPECIES: R3H domain-containing nucleic acid-binding protein [Mobiluncus]MCI6583558.1 single-stranded DNA-binding protein [Mobiluncus sp.]MDD7540936.1 single-stranded DNA-binding protein [Mobiluncus porci]MDY5748965.1 R3H domain-containing nucleic acid-binding protein [Mobiluncus porci]MST49099.1 single-stranded DNA-binding protein [Mobiluncus porci]
MTSTEQIDDLDIIEEDTEVVANHGSKIERLEAEGDIAADYLEELLDIADLDGDIEIDVENGRALVEIVTEDEEPDRRLNRLVGRHGEVLESLQELTRLAVQSQTGERSRLMLDIIGYRADRREELQALVEDLAEKVKQTGEPVKMQPMNPFERKVCHDMAAELGLYSESEGVAPNRYVVLSLDEGDDEDLDDDSEELVDEDEDLVDDE